MSQPGQLRQGTNFVLTFSLSVFFYEFHEDKECNFLFICFFMNLMKTRNVTFSLFVLF